jgi:hypothetical protein
LRVVQETIVFPKGHPRAALTDRELVEKFDDCARPVLPPSDAAALRKMLFALADQPNLPGSSF